jgi:methionyl aminopeptidase
MTEKHYGGASSHGLKGKASNKTNITPNTKDKLIDKSRIKDNEKSNSGDNSVAGYSNFVKAGEIARQVREYVKTIVKPGMPLLELAEKIESKTLELGGKPAFPCNLSINEIAAHYTPSFNDETKASGLLKVDFGVSINGCVSDNAISFDLENNQENKKLIEAAELALKKATETISLGITISKIGKQVEESIKSFGFQPIQNLSGHSIEPYNLHSGITVPNYDNSSNREIIPGVYAIEPFSTNGLGSVRDGKPSGIYKVEKPGAVRDNFAREVLDYILEEFQTLPFCSRWIYKKFSSRGLLALRQIEQAGILHNYPQLIESGKGKVAQAEHTIIITDKSKIIMN